MGDVLQFKPKPEEPESDLVSVIACGCGNVHFLVHSRGALECDECGQIFDVDDYEDDE